MKKVVSFLKKGVGKGGNDFYQGEITAHIVVKL
jgi:hypothetical protein